MRKKWIWMPALLLMLFLAFDMDPVHAEVTTYTRYRQKDTELDKYIYSCLFEIDGGTKYAFCIERSKMTPSVGSTTGEWIELFNEDLRKVLYYGYGGPRDMGYTVVETSCAAAAANGDNDTSIGANILAEIVLLESPPENFRIWMVETNNGVTQDIAFYTTLTCGDLMVQKVSANKTVTDGDSNYSVEGAVFGLYTDAECTNQIAILTTDENGLTESVTVDEAIYYLKELVAPPGYQLYEEVIEVQAMVEQVVTVEVADEPILKPAELTIHKINDVGESLAGAAFAIYADRDGTELLGRATTGEDGKLIFTDLINGHTYYVREISPPDGYMQSLEIYEVVANGGEFTISNEKRFILPNTGSSGMLILGVAGLGCIVKSMKKKEK